jgi:hypothetical protein
MAPPSVVTNGSASPLSTLSNSSTATPATGADAAAPAVAAAAAADDPVMAPRVGGRPASKDVWDHVGRVQQQDGKCKQVCKHCNKSKESKQHQTSYWVDHLVVECKKSPMEVRQAVAKNSRSKKVEAWKVEQKKRGATSPFLEEAYDTGKRSAGTKKQKLISESADFCDEVRAKHISDMIMQYIAGTAISTIYYRSGAGCH